MIALTAANDRPVLSLYGTREDRATQSDPVNTLVTQHRMNGAIATTICRVWGNRDKPTCGGLCPAESCNFLGGVCQIGVNQHVDPESAPRFRQDARHL